MTNQQLKDLRGVIWLLADAQMMSCEEYNELDAIEAPDDYQIYLRGFAKGSLSAFGAAVWQLQALVT